MGLFKPLKYERDDERATRREPVDAETDDAADADDAGDAADADDDGDGS